jgi:hypothetical protein
MSKNPLTVIPAPACISYAEGIAGRKAGILKIPGQARDDKNMDKNLVSFLCIHCHAFVPIHPYMGTSHRNHCPFCLWSKHVDNQQPGDRKSTCQSAMEPITLTFKHEGMDKYGKQKQGELMIVHVCTKCGKININRIAGDDDAIKAMSLLDTSHVSTDILTKIQEQGIKILNNENTQEVQKQLLGITHI